MLRPRVLTLPSHIQGIYIQNLMKVFAVALSRAEENDDKNRALVLTRALLQTLPLFVQSSYLEVQERVGFNLLGCLYVNNVICVKLSLFVLNLNCDKILL